MRFAGPDVVLFVAGLLIFSGSVYGLTKIPGGLSGGSTSPFGAFTITWQSTTKDLPAKSFATAPSAKFDFTVNGTGVTRVVLKVDCTYDVQNLPASTPVTVKVTGPANKSVTGKGTCGTPFQVVAANATEPKTSVEQAANADDAAKAAVGRYSGLAGKYVVEATFEPSSAGPVPVPVQVQYTTKFTPTLTLASASATPVTR